MNSADDETRDRMSPVAPDLREAAADLPRRGPCPGDDRLLGFYRGDLGEADEEQVRDHVASCAACVARARDARDFAATVGHGAASPAAPATPRRWRPWIGLAAAIAGVAIVAAWSVRRGAVSPPAAPGGAAGAALAWADLAVTPAPYRPPAPPDGAGGDVVYRDGTAGDPFAAAMARYLAGDFTAAETALEALVAANSGGEEARFYLAVTRLLNGRAEDARRELETLERRDAGARRGEVGWYLALALLKAGRVAEARPRLDAIAAAGGPHAPEARALLDRMGHGSRP